MTTKTEMISLVHEVFNDARESMLAISKVKHDLLQVGYTHNEIQLMIEELTAAYLDHIP